MRGTDEPPWGPPSAGIAVLLGLALGFASTVAVEVAGQIAGSSLANPSTAVSLLASLAFDASFVGAALYVARARGGTAPRLFGYRALRLRTAVLAVGVGGGGYYLLSDLYASLLSLHAEKLPRELGFGGGTVSLIAAGLFVCVAAPILEEFFFRGFLFGALRQLPLRARGIDLGPLTAALLVALLFGLAHAGSAPARYLVPLGLFGFVLCLVRWRTRSLYPCMALHAINNALALGVNQLRWGAAAVVLLLAASVLVVTALTAPLGRARAPART